MEANKEEGKRSISADFVAVPALTICSKFDFDFAIFVVKV